MCHIYPHAMNAFQCKFSIRATQSRCLGFRRLPNSQVRGESPPWGWLACLVVQTWLAILIQLLPRGRWDLGDGLPCNPEFLSDDVTEVLEVLESFLKGINSRSSLWISVLASVLCEMGRSGSVLTYHRSGFSCSSSALRGGEWHRHRTRLRGYKNVRNRVTG